MFYKEGGLCWFILAGATDESTKLMQYKLVVNISKKRVEGYQEMFVSLHRGLIKFFITKANFVKEFL